MPDTSGLSAKNLSLTIGQQNILHDIHLSLQAGQVMGVLGPNGAGKTSLLKMLSGQIDSRQSVSWNNQVLSEYDALSLARQIAVVNQLNDSVFALNLYQIVRMGLLPHKSLLSRQSESDQQSIEQAIRLVGLEGKRQQTFSSLSGGEQQRGLIARALVQKAALIILDEPVNHLDVYYQHQVLTLLSSLAHDFNITVVMSLHDINLAANYCDHLCLLNKGEMVAQGSPAQVLTCERLEQVFRVPCKIRNNGDGFAVDFYPPDNTQTSALLANKVVS